MNWFDIVIIAIIAVGAFMGMRTGLIGAAITAVGGIIGWLIAGRLSDKVGGLFGDSLSNDTIVTVISYIVIVAVALFIARIVARIVRPILSIATLGLSSMVDKLGGLALGLLLGLAISSAFIVVMARFAYNFELPGEGIVGAAAASIPNVQDALGSVQGAVGTAADSIPNVQGAIDSVEGAVTTAAGSIAVVQDTRDSVEGALTASAIVPVFINIANALPGDTLGFVPEDFRVSLEILDQAIEDEDEGSS